MPITETSYRTLVAGLPKTSWFEVLGPQLIELWADDYESSNPMADLLETTIDGATYLFDLQYERAVGMYGRPRPVGHKRDASRMKGHPLSEGPGYHRGHLLAHSLGGGADINLVPQLGSLNVGAFRQLEKLALASSQSFYFVRPVYEPANAGQRPDELDQGLVLGPGALQFRRHPNR